MLVVWRWLLPWTLSTPPPLSSLRAPLIPYLRCAAGSGTARARARIARVVYLGWLAGLQLLPLSSRSNRWQPDSSDAGAVGPSDTGRETSDFTRWSCPCAILDTRVDLRRLNTATSTVCCACLSWAAEALLTAKAVTISVWTQMTNDLFTFFGTVSVPVLHFQHYIHKYIQLYPMLLWLRTTAEKCWFLFRGQLVNVWSEIFN